MKERNIAIVLAAGQGKRMNSAVPKQYLLIRGKPVLYYSLRQFQECSFMDEIILVTGKDEIEYCQKEIVSHYGFDKVRHIIPGGAERYDSVYEGIKKAPNCTYLYIHDGARPFLNQEILERSREGVRQYGACVAGMPVKDTIKISDPEGFAEYTPPRELVWMVQTPQIFRYEIIKEAYTKLMSQADIQVTDDAMVLEQITGKKAKLIQGSYGNIKITTPEDLAVAEIYEKNIEKGIDI